MQRQKYRIDIASLICGILSLTSPSPWLILLYGSGTNNWFTNNIFWLLLSSIIVLGFVASLMGLIYGLSCTAKAQINIELNNKLAHTGIVLSIIGLVSAILQSGFILITALITTSEIW